MLTYFIVKLLLSFAAIFLLPLLSLPNATLPAFVVSSITTASGWIGLFDIFLPVSALLSVFGAYLLVEGFIFTYKLIKWAYSKIPGIN